MQRYHLMIAGGVVGPKVPPQTPGQKEFTLPEAEFLVIRLTSYP